MSGPTVEQIRFRYPSPIKTPANWPYFNNLPLPQDCYCVGGALGLFLGCASGFPSTEQLTDCLLRANLNLTELEAEWFSNSIMAENDAGLFEAAWRLMDEAVRSAQP